MGLHDGAVDHAILVIAHPWLSDKRLAFRRPLDPAAETRAQLLPVADPLRQAVPGHADAKAQPDCLDERQLFAAAIPNDPLGRAEGAQSGSAGRLEGHST